MTTAGTEPIKLETVGVDREPVRGGDFFLEAFNVAIGEFHDLAAAGTDEMVVMAFMGDVVVLRLGAEVPRLGEAGLAKQVEGAIDRGQAQMRIFFGELVVHLLSRDVFLLEKRVEDEFALTRELQLVLAKVLFERLHLFRMSHADRLLPQTEEPIKDETSAQGQGRRDARAATASV
jgi:hypothetical protein